MSTTRRDGHFSFEFFPPRTEKGAQKLRWVYRELGELQPDFFSVTYGAGGSTKDGTRQLVLELHKAGLPVAPHLSFGGSDQREMLERLNDYQLQGIRRIVALRGDIPSGTGLATQHIYANELVAFIRKHTGRHFQVDVACYPEIHPQSESYDRDIHFFKKKVDAGADGAITQYFYNADAYFYFVDRCREAGIDVPIVPGIMPITNFSKLARFSDSCGAEIPRWIRKRLQGYGDDSESIQAFGEEVVTRLCERLLEGGAPGLHFYTLNQSGAVTKLWKNLGL
ncbi:MAG: methylenetetrahydrofolate reductase [NAD(P)H] [Pseudomonadota bacterium]